jgi:hypothetical protein
MKVIVLAEIVVAGGPMFFPLQSTPQCMVENQYNFRWMAPATAPHRRQPTAKKEQVIQSFTGSLPPAQSG